MQNNLSKTLYDVKNFWEENPLWEGESQYEAGREEFFEEHRRIVLEDCLSGRHDQRIFPCERNRRKVLDLGCGPGFWTVELSKNGCKDIISADLTLKALKLTKKRCDIQGIEAYYTQQNAEKLAFKDGVFSHVNCTGVVHHTPNTEACISEIARVLENNGTATISVYYKNIFLSAWPVFKWIGKLLEKTGAGLTGRGRENIFSSNDISEIVRLYDGMDNPIGKCYTRLETIRMIAPSFIIKEMFLHFFPVRTLPFKVPKMMHKILDRNLGFMIYATLKKR